MKPMSASVRRAAMRAERTSDAARTGGGHGGPASALLRLHEDLVPESARVGHMVEYLGPLGARGIDLDPAVADHATKQGLLGRAVLDPVDWNDLRLAAEHAGLDLDALVGERVRGRLPAHPYNDEPDARDGYRGQRDVDPKVLVLEQLRRLVDRLEERQVGDRHQHEQHRRRQQVLGDNDPMWVRLDDEVLAGKEFASHGAYSPATRAGRCRLGPPRAKRR